MLGHVNVAKPGISRAVLGSRFTEMLKTWSMHIERDRTTGPKVTLIGSDDMATRYRDGSPAYDDSASLW